ncbi:protein kinase domain-containing protein [Desulfobacca acetoxidans]|uniref:Putative PAS/PAC sensor protein n=1 Tax=Desulfobacca acetoxidans (strain ATCC 700848 / DSM 11109 / ASRB2) TaxID=880072 RepID=F2NEY8_DESAR|nr:protein kinase [Desulfobacca acetoxidans]AEB08328.1 putative PAS/PAC sensor protein [Desulfobacca acetoxidans DSM 11109]
MAGYRILLVDLAAEDYQALAEILTSEGHELFLLPEHSDALMEAQQFSPDLVILNIQTEFGLQRFRELKSQDFLKHLPFIFIIATHRTDLAARSLEIGAEDFILKPFQGGEILARIAVALKVREHELRLQAVRDRYRRLFEDSPQGIFITDQTRRLLDCNQALKALLGYEAATEITEFDLAADLFYTPADYQRFYAMLNREGETGKVKVNLKHRDGHKVTVLMSGQVVKGKPDRVIAYADVDLDLSEAPAHLPAHIASLSGRPSRKKSLLNMISRLLPFAGNILSVLKLTELLGGRYEKVKKLGQGSYGEVWLVLDTEAVEQDHYYVAKIPFSRGYNKSFRKEADICQKLAPHPGAVALIDSVEEAGRFIIIQEYVRGRTLQDLLEGRELPDSWKERIILKLIDVVAFAHSHHIMHRDIKPNNIIIGPHDTIKLLDYGAAKELKDRDISATMVGSRPYMAPEQIMGQSQRPSDVWAIGVIMYLLYTGLLPFYDDLEKNLIDLILESEPIPPHEENPDIPLALEAIILKCLEKDLSKRYPDAQALRDDLVLHFPSFGAEPVELEQLEGELRSP